MLYWVEWAYRNAPAWLRGAVNWVVGFVTGVFRVITAQFTRNLKAWRSLFSRIWAFRTALHNVIRETYRILVWLRNVWVPRLVGIAKDLLIAFVRATAAAIRRAFQLADSLLDRLIRSSVALLRRLIDVLARWAREAINAIWRTIPESIRRAWQLLLNPERLAAWAARAMFFAMLRLAERESERIGRWLLSRGNRFTLMFAQVAIRVIERIW
jgi:hypothetical protein